MDARDELAGLLGWRFVMDREIGPIGWQDPNGLIGAAGTGGA